MILRSLYLYQFKNFEEGHFRFADKINAITGPNGAGKTNVLDAIHMLAFGKSYFHMPLRQVVRHGADGFSVKGTFKNGEEPAEVLVRYRKGDRRIVKRNGKVYDRLAEHIGLIPAVMISPYDRDLITEGGEIRRKFMDKIISQFDKKYLADLTAYHRYLMRRNALLKTMASGMAADPATLRIYDEQLARYGTRIADARRRFIVQFRPLLKDKYAWISSGREEVDIRYRTALDEKPPEELLRESFERDRMLGYTTRGIHRDDLEFLIDGYPIRRFGSQGQQKSFLIALKLAEYDLLKSRMHRRPLLLFDDIFDKLDPARVRQIVRLVETGDFGQVFLTDTYPDRLENLLAEFGDRTKIIHL
ncbi:MAG: DNA replication/repair protein RecF [Chlorobi bacterium]|nr:DNA replication/repair protein RecF [Chlorobiota bacterium]